MTPRESEVVALVRREWPSKRIAGVLGISADTVDKHIENAAKRLPNPDNLPARALLRATDFSVLDGQSAA